MGPFGRTHPKMSKRDQHSRVLKGISTNLVFQGASKPRALSCGGGRSDGGKGVCGSPRTHAASPLAQVHSPVGTWTRTKASSRGMRSGMPRWEGLSPREGGFGRRQRGDPRGTGKSPTRTRGWTPGGARRGETAIKPRQDGPRGAPGLGPEGAARRSDVRPGSFRGVRGREVPQRGKRSREPGRTRGRKG